MGEIEPQGPHEAERLVGFGRAAQQAAPGAVDPLRQTREVSAEGDFPAAVGGDQRQGLGDQREHLLAGGIQQEHRTFGVS